jgi:2-aminoethylphosphonate-pyruvate transaminase
MLLLNPGPVKLSERVRRSLLQPDLCHRESEFFDLRDEARERLLATYALAPEEWSAVLMTASGTAAVESMIVALVPKISRLLIVENGMYGERMAQICAVYGIAHDRVAGAWLEAPDLGTIAKRLDAAASAPFTHLAGVQHETTTGWLNDPQALGKLCEARKIGLLVDGVSSLGAELIDFNAVSLEAVAATANNCLHGVPGVSFVIVRRLRRRCMRTMRWLRRCANSPSKAGGSLATGSMRRLRSRCARGWPNLASRLRCRPRSRRWCCALTACRRALPTRRCTMP